MAEEKILKVRQQQKTDKQENWNTAGEKGFIPKKGEIIVYQEGESSTNSKIKIGDGATNINDLSFLSSGGSPASSVSWEDIEDKPDISKGTGQYSIVEGIGNSAEGQKSHAEGSNVIASGDCSHAEGNSVCATGFASHAEGWGACQEIEAYPFTYATGIASHAEGLCTVASGDGSHAEGTYLIDEDNNINETEASGKGSHAEGAGSKAYSHSSHAEGYNTTAGFVDHSNDTNNPDIEEDEQLIGQHAEGVKTTASGRGSHAEGESSNVFTEIPNYGTTDGEIQTNWDSTKFALAHGKGSHVEGHDCLALGAYSHAEGNLSVAIGASSHAEGYKTKATGKHSHVEGNSTTVSADWGHAEGYDSSVSERYGHAEGHTTSVEAEKAHAEGWNTVVTAACSHVQGKFNHLDENNKSGDYAHIVGNGTSNTKRSNAHTLDWSGNAWFAGNITTKGIIVEDNEGNQTNMAIIPETTQDDNGKLLQVVNGKPAWVSITNGNEVAY